MPSFPSAGFAGVIGLSAGGSSEAGPRSADGSASASGAAIGAASGVGVGTASGIVIGAGSTAGVADGSGVVVGAVPSFVSADAVGAAGCISAISGSMTSLLGATSSCAAVMVSASASWFLVFLQLFLARLRKPPPV